MNDDLWCYTCFPNSVHAAHKEGKTMSKIVTDKPDPDCYLCDGRGVVGGCWECRLVHAVGFRPEHQHTYSFCRCVNERTVEVTDDDIETQTPWKMHDWNLGKGGADDDPD